MSILNSIRACYAVAKILSPMLAMLNYKSPVVRIVFSSVLLSPLIRVLARIVRIRFVVAVLLRRDV